VRLLLLLRAVLALLIWPGGALHSGGAALLPYQPARVPSFAVRAIGRVDRGGLGLACGSGRRLDPLLFLFGVTFSLTMTSTEAGDFQTRRLDFFRRCRGSDTGAVNYHGGDACGRDLRMRSASS
jgi:hypothetical protein